MRSIIVSAAIVACSMVLSGCATIIHMGGSEDLDIKSNPPGATVVVDGAGRGVTPMTVDVERKKDHTVVLTKDGYQEQTVKVDHGVSWWLLGNAVFGGIIGLVVDLVSGGGYSLDPSDINVSLTSTGTAQQMSLGELTAREGSSPTP
ncbi:MAG: PEGA domain-containing protein [Nitrospiraceae bacterium]